MRQREAEQWHRAAFLARMAMGRNEKPGRRRTDKWNADLDPLAHWLLTEAIMDIHKPRAALTKATKERHHEQR